MGLEQLFIFPSFLGFLKMIHCCQSFIVLVEWHVFPVHTGNNLLPCWVRLLFREPFHISEYRITSLFMTGSDHYWSPSFILSTFIKSGNPMEGYSRRCHELNRLKKGLKLLNSFQSRPEDLFLNPQQACLFVQIYSAHRFSCWIINKEITGDNIQSNQFTLYSSCDRLKTPDHVVAVVTTEAQAYRIWKVSVPLHRPTITLLHWFTSLSSSPSPMEGLYLLLILHFPLPPSSAHQSMFQTFNFTSSGSERMIHVTFTVNYVAVLWGCSSDRQMPPGSSNRYEAHWIPPLLAIPLTHGAN
jgi:hypothetical protein